MLDGVQLCSIPSLFWVVWYTLQILMLECLFIEPTGTVKNSGYVLSSPPPNYVLLLRIVFFYADEYPSHQSLSSMLIGISRWIQERLPKPKPHRNSNSNSNNSNHDIAFIFRDLSFTDPHHEIATLRSGPVSRQSWRCPHLNQLIQTIISSP